MKKAQELREKLYDLNQEERRSREPLHQEPYVYYHCTRTRDPNCQEPYIREEALINQLVGILGKVDIDKLAVENRFTEDLIRYRGFMQSVLKQSDDMSTATEVDRRDYAKHILMTGKREDKQAGKAFVTTTLYLKTKIIRTRKPKMANFSPLNLLCI